jgi:3-oxoacyl-[acyl-carrier protein] reductase
MGMLDGRVAIVTAGGGPGIGSAISGALAAEGAAVVIAEIDPERAAQAAGQIEAAGGRALSVPTDVSKGADVEQMVEQAVRAFGKVDILANHAGISPSGPIEGITEEMWDRALGVHLKSAFLCSKAVLPYMKQQEWGRIVSTSSRTAYRAMTTTPGLVDYSAAKAGMIGFSRSLAMEVGRFGITVNVVAPGLVSGSGMSALRELSPEEETRRSQVEGQVLPPRYVRPDEIAAMYLYLVGPNAERITGQVIHINGGSYFNG